jgi:hypothetical protein
VAQALFLLPTTHAFCYIHVDVSLVHAMPDSNILNKLRAATVAEREDAITSLARYEALTAKITAYQNGTGEAPTVEEFQQWREDVERTVALRRLQGGLPQK